MKCPVCGSRNITESATSGKCHYCNMVWGIEEEEKEVKDFDYKTIIGEMVGLSNESEEEAKKWYKHNPFRLCGTSVTGRLVGEDEGGLLGMFTYIYHPSMEPRTEQLAEKWACKKTLERKGMHVLAYIDGGDVFIQMAKSEYKQDLKETFIAGRESNMNVYRCRFCQCYHIGHKPGWRR